MGRAEDRKKKKKIRTKLNDKQYNALISGVHYEHLRREIEMMKEETLKIMAVSFINALRENRVSAERTNKIIDDAISKFEMEYKKLRSDSYVEERLLEQGGN